LPENPVLIEPRLCHFAGNSFPLLKVNLVSRNSTPVSRNSRNHLEAYGGCATRCSKNPSFFMLNPVINTMREFWGDCGIFTPPKHPSTTFSSGKHQFEAWHKTCVQLRQYAMAIDVVAAELRPQKDVQP
jgi:hypothetical protein